MKTIKVRAPRIEGAPKERVVLNDTINDKHVVIFANNATHEVDADHGRIKELLNKGELVEVQAKAEGKADASK